eukprot:TRINITY_DN66666_c7_g2_i1.p1 TRINITY_DN66666_c7_g2~~TRINITY_DN66666_c7_g2_i1.p1  ORF type:complete len:221 (+),score=28.34 TRINITY_DN66666_c7_g2_i1:51-713(+)
MPKTKMRSRANKERKKQQRAELAATRSPDPAEFVTKMIVETTIDEPEDLQERLDVLLQKTRDLEENTQVYKMRAPSTLSRGTAWLRSCFQFTKRSKSPPQHSKTTTQTTANQHKVEAASDSDEEFHDVPPVLEFSDDCLKQMLTEEITARKGAELSKLIEWANPEGQEGVSTSDEEAVSVWVQGVVLKKFGFPTDKQTRQAYATATQPLRQQQQGNQDQA